MLNTYRPYSLSLTIHSALTVFIACFLAVSATYNNLVYQPNLSPVQECKELCLVGTCAVQQLSQVECVYIFHSGLSAVILLKDMPEYMLVYFPYLVQKACLGQLSLDIISIRPIRKPSILKLDYLIKPLTITRTIVSLTVYCAVIVCSLYVQTCLFMILYLNNMCKTINPAIISMAIGYVQVLQYLCLLQLYFFCLV